MQLVIVSTANVRCATTTDMGTAMGRSSVQMLHSMTPAARNASVSKLHDISLFLFPPASKRLVHRVC